MSERQAHLIEEVDDVVAIVNYDGLDAERHEAADGRCPDRCGVGGGASLHIAELWQHLVVDRAGQSGAARFAHLLGFGKLREPHEMGLAWGDIVKH